MRFASWKSGDCALDTIKTEVSYKLCYEARRFHSSLEGLFVTPQHLCLWEDFSLRNVIYFAALNSVLSVFESRVGIFKLYSLFLTVDETIMQKSFRMLLFNFHGLLTQTVYNPNCQTNWSYYASWMPFIKQRNSPKFPTFERSRRNYFHNGARFVIFHLDPSNYQIAFQGIPWNRQSANKVLKILGPVQLWQICGKYCSERRY